MLKTTKETYACFGEVTVVRGVQVPADIKSSSTRNSVINESERSDTELQTGLETVSHLIDNVVMLSTWNSKAILFIYQRRKTTST